MDIEGRSMADGRTTVLLEDGTERRSNRKAWIIGAIVAVVAIALAAMFFMGGDDAAETGAGEAGAASKSGAMPTVTFVVPGRQVTGSVISGTGSLAARREMPVGVAGEGGLVTRVLVEPGTWVNAGQVLAVVDRSVQTQTAETLAAQVRVARAEADLSQSELDRAKQLVARGFVSTADIERRTATRDGAVARVRAAEAQLAETRARNNRLDIRAPAAGLVLTRAVEPGQIVSSGTGVLFRIAQGGQLEMRAQLSEGDLARVTAGIQAEVTPVGSTEAFPGQVWQVSPVIDPATRQGIARIALSYSPALRPGGFASARITSGASSAPVLPDSAVLSDNEGSFVYILNAQDETVRRTVRIGEVSDVGIQILDGLDGTERVVRSAGAFLSPGQKVIARREAAQGQQPAPQPAAQPKQ